MSVDLDRDIRTYVSYLGSVTAPVDESDVLSVAGSTASPPSGGWRKVRVAAAAAAATLVLVGGVAWLLGSSADVDPVDEPTPTTTTLPPTTTQPVDADAAVIFSDSEWVQVPLDEATFGPTSRLMAVAASDSMVVVGGSVGGSAAIWTSTDRVTWTRVPHDEDLFGGPGNQEIKAIVPWGSGFVAAGEVGGIGDFNPLRVAVVWTSEDGLTWTRVPHDEAVFGGDGRQEVFSMAATTDGLLITGFDEEPAANQSGNGTVQWTSPDGDSWSKRVVDDPGSIRAVVGNSDGFIAIGDSTWRVSADGGTWERLGLGTDEMVGVVSTPSGLVAVGHEPDSDAWIAVWTSPDGADWTRSMVDIPAEMEPSILVSVAASESGLAAVGNGIGGWYPGGPGVILVSADGATWELVDASDSLAESILRSIAGFGSHFVIVGNTHEGGPVLWTTGG